MIKRVLRVAIFLVAGYFLAAAIGGLWLGFVDSDINLATADAPDTIEIGLVFNGPIHVDFMLPATAQTRAAFHAARDAGTPIYDPDVTHIIVGWGARGFYTTTGDYGDLTFGATYRAITGDDAVLRVDVTSDDFTGHKAARLRLSLAQYEALLQAIQNTTTGQAVARGIYTPTDVFLQADGRFHVFQTCNTWISRMLRQAGVPFGVWTPAPYSVRLSLWRMGAAQ
jgi:uncharacterized protein (TIGR02117 family)